MDITKLPENLLLDIFRSLGQETKLKLANVNKKFRSIIFTGTRNLLWDELAVVMTTGIRTLPLQRKLAASVRSLSLTVSSLTNVGALPVFHSVESLKFKDDTSTSTRRTGDSFSAPMLHRLKSKFPALQTLKIEGDLSLEKMGGIARFFPWLREFSLDGELDLDLNLGTESISVASLAATLDSFDNTVLCVEKVRLDVDPRSEVLDCLAESKLARRLQTLSLCAKNLIREPRTLVGRFESLRALRISLSDEDDVLLIYRWMQNIRHSPPSLKTLKFKFVPGWQLEPFFEDLECLPVGLETLALIDIDGISSEILAPVYQRLPSLKNVVLMGCLDFDLPSTISTLVTPETGVEYINIYGLSTNLMTSEEVMEDFQKVYDYLFRVAPNLTALKFLCIRLTLYHEEEEGRTDIVDFDSLDWTALQERMPASAAGGCLIRFGDHSHHFSRNEAEFIRGLDGFKETRRPLDA